MKVTITPMIDDFRVVEADWEDPYMFTVVNVESYGEPVAGFLAKEHAELFAELMNGRWGNVSH